MALLYRTFLFVRTGLCVSFLAGLWVPSPVQAQVLTPAETATVEVSPFTVENIVVDETAENALKARENAFAQAQVKAFLALAEKTGPSGHTVPAPAPAVLAPMIQDYEVTSEKLSSKRYIGTYTFRFDEQAVRQYFGQQGLAVNTEMAGPAQVAQEQEAPVGIGAQAPSQDQAVPEGHSAQAQGPLLVLPFLEDADGRLQLWTPANGFLKAWASASDLGIGPIPLIVPMGDLADVSAVGDDEALHYDPRNMTALVQRYGADSAVVLVARRVPEGLDIKIYSATGGGPAYVTTKRMFSATGQDEASLYGGAVAMVRQVFQSGWQKTAEAVPQEALAAEPAPAVPARNMAIETTFPRGEAQEGDHQGVTTVRVAFGSLGEWANVQKALARVSGVYNMSLKALSPREAYLDLAHHGNRMALQAALAQAGLVLAQSPRGQTAALGTPVYDLSLQGEASAENIAPQAGGGGAVAPEKPQSREWHF